MSGRGRVAMRGRVSVYLDRSSRSSRVLALLHWQNDQCTAAGLVGCCLRARRGWLTVAPLHVVSHRVGAFLLAPTPTDRRADRVWLVAKRREAHGRVGEWSPGRSPGRWAILPRCEKK